MSAGLATKESVSRVLKCFALAKQRASLSDAVENEEYAEAAMIRDHIRLLEDQLGNWESEDQEE